MPKLRQTVLILMGVIVGGIVVGGVFAATHGGGEVRIAAQKHADGRVEVALQEKLDDGAWGERRLPDRRFLAAAAPAGRWLTSSSVETAPAQPAAVAAPAPPPYPVCVVHHASDADEFWLNLGRNAYITGLNFGLAVTVHGSADRAEQAKLIRDCADNGAKAIATSVPNADALRGAISYAQDAGVLLLTFNSGSGDAEDLDVAVHVALDEEAVGRHAGNAFNEAKAEGIALCVLHERDDSGLEERCDALERAYAGGAMERIYVVGVEDIERSTAQLTERLQAGGVGAVMTLNTSLMLPSAAAAQAAGADVKIGGIGALEAVQAVATGTVLFAITDQPWFQIDYALASIRNFLGAIDLGLPLSGISISPATLVFVEPFVIDRELAFYVLARLQELLGEDFPAFEGDQ